MSGDSSAATGDVQLARPDEYRYAGREGLHGDQRRHSGQSGTGRLNLDVSPRQPDGTIYIQATGDWDRTAAADIRSVFREVSQREPGLVIADLDGLRRMDTAGLGALVAAYRHIARSGGQLQLQNVPPHVQRLLRRTQLTHALTPDSEDRRGQHLSAQASGASAPEAAQAH